MRDFWEHDMQIRQTRAEIRSKLLDMEVTVPSVNGKINDIVQKIIELGREHYK
jgi:type I restriction enzyme R subunit